MRVDVYTYTSTTPQTRDRYKTKGDQQAESTEHVRVSAVCGVLLDTLVVFSVWFLYYIPNMFMFVLPLVRVWGRVEISQNWFIPATHACRCPKSGASYTPSESQLQFWTTVVIYQYNVLILIFCTNFEVCLAKL